jgi:phenylacetate-CoA ligase
MLAPFEEIVATINEERPDLLTAYGGFLDVFFRTLLARGAEIHPPKVVMYVGETLPAERREWIERELGARVMSRYVASEAFKIGYFCERRTGFHLHDDLCHVRVMRADGSDAPPGEAGEVVISNLVNRGTVLLNYPMGDLAAFAGESCACGRGHRLLSELHGRVEDVLPLANGEHLHPRAVWSVFRDDRRVLQYQLVQHELRRFELKLVVADEGAFPQSRDRAIRELRGLLGEDARIDASRHPQLGRDEREKTGKFRAVESRVTATTRRRS